jgi:high-affinity nickel permease
MFGLDEWIAGIGAGHPLLLASVVAVLLGLRHAADPDPLTAVTTLVAADPDRRPHRALRMGLAWGAGHATTLFAFGVPIVLFASYLPMWAERLAGS